MAETLEAQQARWDRLRHDPDYEPGWLRAMGPRPTAPGAHREWADGVGDKREHVVVDVSFARGFIECADGWYADGLPGARGIEREWDIHRGVGEAVAGRVWDAAYGADEAELATDEDVSAFLRRVSDPSYSYVPEVD